MRRSANWADRMEPTRHIRSFGTFGEDWPSSDLVEIEAEDLSFLGRARDRSVSCAIPEDPEAEDDAETVVDLPPSEQVTRPIPEQFAPLARPMPQQIAPLEHSKPLPRRTQGKPAFRGYVPARPVVPAPRRTSGVRWREAIMLFASVCAILVLLATMVGVVAGMFV